MTHSPHPQASCRDARGNCARNLALLHTLLLALLATLLGRPRTLHPVWHTTALADSIAWGAATTLCAWDPDCAENDDTACTYDDDRALLAILYVLGPGPNRGLNPTPRENPVPRPGTARAPPAAARQRPFHPLQGMPTHAHFVPLS